MRSQPSLRLLVAALGAALVACPRAGAALEVVRIEKLQDGDLQTEVFRLTRPLALRVRCEGAGDGGAEGMYAYGWILDARSRERVWSLEPDAGRKHGRNDVFDAEVQLPAGDYIASYAAYGDWRRKQKIIRFLGKEIYRIEIDTDRSRRKHRDSQRWGLWISTTSAADAPAVELGRSREGADPRAVVQMIGLGDDEFRQEGFTLAERTPLTIYCLGEWNESDDSMADTGWILDAETRKRVWELGPDNFRHAGGDAKNKLGRETVTLAPGSYVVFYSCDGSHASGSWNAPPPWDADSWGITLWALTPEAARRVRPYREGDDTRRTILALVRQGNDAYATEGLTLTRPARVRVYAIGEYDAGDDRFADQGWIEEYGSGKRLWSMTPRNTHAAGGAAKNRAADEILSLAAGDYVVYCMTDDSHAYGDWNAAPPHDPERWGITLFGVGPDFERADFKRFDPEQREETGREYLVRLVRVGDDAHVQQRFRLDRPTRVRILAVGEGVDGEMADYGWIEDLDTRTPVWEMTWRNSRHAGGADKNRLFDGTVLLDRGDYEAHFVTDGSHAWRSWNAPPPDDPGLWGLTVLLQGDKPKP